MNEPHASAPLTGRRILLTRAKPDDAIARALRLAQPAAEGEYIFVYIVFVVASAGFAEQGRGFVVHIIPSEVIIIYHNDITSIDKLQQYVKRKSLCAVFAQRQL